jgi:hypothetical protein
LLGARDREKWPGVVANPVATPEKNAEKPHEGKPRNSGARGLPCSVKPAVAFNTILVDAETVTSVLD